MSKRPTTLCSCCHVRVWAATMATRFGDFESPWGLCRRCWRGVPRPLRRLFAKALRGYRLWPTLERGVEVYELWLLCLGERVLRRAA